LKMLQVSIVKTECTGARYGRAALQIRAAGGERTA